MRYVVIEPGGAVSVKEGALPYDTLCGIVGYPVETRLVGKGTAYMYMCEDGKRLGQPLNGLATTIAHTLRPDDFVVGTVVVVGPPDQAGEDTSVPPDVEQWIETLAAFRDGVRP